LLSKTTARVKLHGGIIPCFLTGKNVLLTPHWVQAYLTDLLGWLWLVKPIAQDTEGTRSGKKAHVGLQRIGFEAQLAWYTQT
jgi:hypothetical protein